MRFEYEIELTYPHGSKDMMVIRTQEEWTEEMVTKFIQKAEEDGTKVEKVTLYRNRITI
jgi:hypothetical protein